MLTHFFQCPYCGETISMLFDTSIRHQKYIEDCEVCCHPIALNVVVENLKITSFIATSIEQ